MTITSYGYPGSVNKIGWALAQRLGTGEYNVLGKTDCKVTAIVSGADRSVRIAAGTIYGNGVVDVVDAPVDVGPLPTVSSGERWDLIVANRNYTTKVTTFTYVTGSSTKALPVRLHSVTDGVDQQPIALVRIVAGQTTPQTVEDLRVGSSEGGAVAFGCTGFEYLVMSYHDRPGTAIRFPDRTRWQFTIDPTSGTNSWIAETPVQYSMKMNPTTQGQAMAPAGNVPASAQFQVQAGTLVATTDGAGGVGVYLPIPFPNGLLSVVLTPSNDYANADMTANIFSYAKTGFSYRVWKNVEGGATYDTRSVAIGYQHQINYIAVGW